MKSQTLSTVMALVLGGSLVFSRSAQAQLNPPPPSAPDTTTAPPQSSPPPPPGAAPQEKHRPQPDQHGDRPQGDRHRDGRFENHSRPQGERPDQRGPQPQHMDQQRGQGEHAQGQRGPGFGHGDGDRWHDNRSWGQQRGPSFGHDQRDGGRRHHHGRHHRRGRHRGFGHGRGGRNFGPQGRGPDHRGFGPGNRNQRGPNEGFPHACGPQGPAPHQQMMGQMHPVGDPIEHISSALNLTADEKAKVQPLLDDTKAQLKAIHDEAAAKTKALMEKAHDQIKPLLTPDQQQKLEHMKPHGPNVPAPNAQAPAPMEPSREALSRHLDLTADQQVKIKAIMEESRPQMQELMGNPSISREDKAAKMKEIHEATSAKIRPLLNPDQQKKWEEMMSRRQPSAGRL